MRLSHRVLLKPLALVHQPLQPTLHRGSKYHLKARAQETPPRKTRMRLGADYSICTPGVTERKES